MTNATTSHPSIFMQEEMDARGWDRDDLAWAMMAADDDNWGVHRLSIDFYFDVGPTNPNMRVGDTGAASFARAFGVSPELFVNLEATWLRGVDGGSDKPSEAAPPSKP